MRRTFFLVLLSILAAGCFTTGPAHADLIMPAITHVYFEKDGVPYNGSVQFTVKCYGYFGGDLDMTRAPGSYQPELIFRFSATCPGYGCEIYQPYYIHGYSDWCDLEGQTENEWFAIRNYSSRPYTRCDFVPDRVSKTWGNQTGYYYDTPEFQACRQFQDPFYHEIRVSQMAFSSTPPANHTNVILLQGKPFYEVFPWNTSTINKSAISMNLDQYIGYLESCLPGTDANCPGWTVDNRPLKSFTGYRTLKDNATEIQQHPCNTFLVDADPSLIMPFTATDIWQHPCAADFGACNYTYEYCEDRFAIASGIQGNWSKPTISTEKTIPWTIMTETRSPDFSAYDADYTTVTTVPVTPQPAPAILPIPHSGLVESLYCSIVEFFGGRCE